MPRPRNFLNHEDCPPEDDTYGWEHRPGITYDVPIWMERMGMLDLPDWMRTADGSCDVDYRAAMGHDKPDIYTTSLDDNDDDDKENTLLKREECRFFARHGRCKYGEFCYFSHELNGNKAGGNDKTSGSRELKPSGWPKEKDIRKPYEQREREAREEREDVEGKKVRTCNYYGTVDGCKRGLSCLNRHVD